MFYEAKHPLNADYYQIEHRQNFSFPPHIHHCFEIIVITEGEMVITIGGKSKVLHKNEAALVFPNQIHSLKTETQSRHTLCIFSGKLVNSFAKQVEDLLPENNFFKLPYYLIGQLEELTEKKSQSTVKGTLYSLCGYFDEQAKYTKLGDSKSDLLLLQIFEYVNKNYSNSCTLKDLSDYLTYDYAYISRIFKLNVGLSYNTFLNQYRISESCYLLRTTDKSILQIGIECGYNSLRSFNRNFKEYIGVSPAKYRNQEIDF